MIYSLEDINFPFNEKKTLLESIEIKEKFKYRLFVTNLLIICASLQTDLLYWECRVKRN